MILCMEVNQSILIIDDISETREGLSKFLTSNGYVVDVASNAKEAIVRIRLKKYDAAFVDMILPDMDGVGLMKELNMLSPSTSLILTYDRLSYEQRLRLGAFAKAGAHFHFLEKPLYEINILKALEGKSAY